MLKSLLNKKNRQSGFTIIEVLIVLAIAGLILVVVLIAIPQLQRNQRNSARQNDIARIGTSASNWVANNNGALLTSAAEPDIISDIGNLAQYDTATFAFDIEAYNTGSPQAAITLLTSIRIVTGAKCGASGAVTNTGAGPRQFAIQYAQENNGGTTSACLDV